MQSRYGGIFYWKGGEIMAGRQEDPLFSDEGLRQALNRHSFEGSEQEQNTDPLAGFTEDERNRLEQLGDAISTTSLELSNLFSPQEMARLRFIRWGQQTGRIES